MGEIEQKYEIHNMTDGMIDFRRNASDMSRVVFETCLKSQSLCVGVAIYLFNPDVQCPEEERWSIASYVPVDDSEMPDNLRDRIRKTMVWIGEQVKAMWLGEEYIPEGRMS